MGSVVGRRPSAGPLSDVLCDVTRAWDETHNNGWWVDHGQRKPSVVSKERKTAIGAEQAQKG